MSVYYNPENYNLAIYCEIDTGGSYEFDMKVVWKQKDTEKYFYGEDSGCSCPIPFESHGLSDLVEISKYNAERYYSKWR